MDQATPSETEKAPGNASLVKERSNGINWFYWISALSIINSIIIFYGSDRSFVIGLGITRLIDTGAKISSRAFRPLIRLINPIIFAARRLEHDLIKVNIDPDVSALLFSILIGAVFILFGVLGNRDKVWAIWVGLVLYAIDTLILLMIGDYLSLIFHIFVLVMLGNGLKAARLLAVQTEG